MGSTSVVFDIAASACSPTFQASGMARDRASELLSSSNTTKLKGSFFETEAEGQPALLFIGSPTSQGPDKKYRASQGLNDLADCIAVSDSSQDRILRLLSQETGLLPGRNSFRAPRTAGHSPKPSSSTLLEDVAALTTAAAALSISPRASAAVASRFSFDAMPSDGVPLLNTAALLGEAVTRGTGNDVPRPDQGVVMRLIHKCLAGEKVCVCVSVYLCVCVSVCVCVIQTLNSVITHPCLYDPQFSFRLECKKLWMPRTPS